jgi:NADH-quinone oxidoreductase subunit C
VGIKNIFYNEMDTNKSVTMHLDSIIVSHYLMYSNLNFANSVFFGDGKIWLNTQLLEDPTFFFKFIKHDFTLAYETLSDLWAIDYPSKICRFQLNYMFWSAVHPFTRVIFSNSLDFPFFTHSACSYFLSAGWLEREIWDMFGVCFYGNKDVRRLLTDYGYEGYPLRKDFPLTGYKEIRYDDEQRRIVSEPVEVSQEFRDFNFRNSWD